MVTIKLSKFDSKSINGGCSAENTSNFWKGKGHYVFCLSAPIIFNLSLPNRDAITRLWPKQGHNPTKKRPGSCYRFEHGTAHFKHALTLMPSKLARWEHSQLRGKDIVYFVCGVLAIFKSRSLQKLIDMIIFVPKLFLKQTSIRKH